MLVMLTNILGDAFVKVESEKEINYMAFYDKLTGLPNRFMFNVRLEQAIVEADAGKSKLAVIFIDLDSFKSVNDTTGHEGGDDMLRQVGRSLGERLGDLGTVSRFGGDEFIIMIPHLNEWDDIQDIAQDIMQTFATPMQICDQEYFVTASAGVAIFPDDGTESNILKKNADMAMYNAKDLGKNQVAFCTQEMKEDVEKKVMMTNLLYRAQQRDEFLLYYQPLIEIETEEIIGVEALLRWDNPELGMVSPCEFIPLAEQTGLINPIGRWVLREACRQNKQWQEDGLTPVRVAVNLSVEQFHNPNLISYIKEALVETGLDPAWLELEITESVAIRETNYICKVLQDIKDLGVSISIDDFGTEYSSLSRIKQLPVDRIKMAMQFVHGIPASVKDEAIAKVIINLAGSLGLKVIAEGVETECQFEFLKNRVCDEVQGYYFYKPMPPS
jgi:diguanylate cyclase (GGDEF)-like protein